MRVARTRSVPVESRVPGSLPSSDSTGFSKIRMAPAQAHSWPALRSATDEFSRKQGRPPLWPSKRTQKGKQKLMSMISEIRRNTVTQEGSVEPMLPPGPRNYPLIGSPSALLHSLARTDERARQYGDIVYYRRFFFDVCD